MDNFNKVASFILGLVVVVVFIAILTGRINIGKKLSSLTAKTTPTPTQVQNKTVTVSTTGNTAKTSTYHSYEGSTPSNIPSTGPETVLLPILFSGAGIGYFLKKIKKS